jgi:hypothetical protein
MDLEEIAYRKDVSQLELAFEAERDAVGISDDTRALTASAPEMR